MRESAIQYRDGTMTNPISRRKILGVAGTAAGSYAVSGILNGKVLAAPSEFCDFVWPMTGNVIQTSDVLEGIHVGNDIGTPIYASRAGEVKSRSRIPTTSEDQDDFLISINHENGYTTSYLPLRGIALEEGDTIEHSQLIGYLGDLESNEIVPGLFFDIRRNAESRPIPGHINEHVAAGEMISKDYAGIECPNGDPEPGPGPIFNDLKNQKIALAERIETISGGSIQEVDQVQAVIGNLETEATNGTISFQEAANAVRRLKLGEEVTERTLVGAGPATPDANGGADYDIATQIGEAMIQAIIEAVTPLITITGAIGKIPGLRKGLRWALNITTRGMKRVIRYLIGVGRHVKSRTKIGPKIRSIIRSIDATIDEIIDTVTDGASKIEVTTILKNKAVHIAELVSSLLLDATLEPELNASLADFTDAANPANGVEFNGTLDGAAQAKEQGIIDANDMFQNSQNTFETFDSVIDSKAFKLIDYLFVVVDAVGVVTGGTVTAISNLGQILFAFMKAIARVVEAEIGGNTLHKIEKNHRETLNGIINGTS